MKVNNIRICAIIFLATFIGYAICIIPAQGDSVWSLHIAESFIRTGNFDLDEYRPLIMPEEYRIEEVQGHLFSVYPLGAPIIAIPFIYALDLFDSLPFCGGVSLSTYLLNQPPDGVVMQLEKIIASLLSAVNCLIIFLLARQYLDIAKSSVLTVIFAFGTSTWSVASRGLWQHGPSMLCLTIAIYILIIAKKKPSLVPLAGFPLAFSFLARPTNIISILLLTAYVWFAYRRYWIYYIICLAVILVPFVLYNYSIYHTLLSPYYSPQKLGNNPFQGSALAATLLSPSRGLFIFSPILIWSIYGFYRTIRQYRLGPHHINLYLFGATILHWITISSFGDWAGGYSIGPRYFTDVIPYLIVFLIPVLDTLQLSNKTSIAIRIRSIVFICLMGFSIFVHYRCSTDIEPSLWNSIPVNYYQDQGRLWDWSDVQFLRGLCPNNGIQAPKCWY